MKKSQTTTSFKRLVRAQYQKAGQNPSQIPSRNNSKPATSKSSKSTGHQSKESQTKNLRTEPGQDLVSQVVVEPSELQKTSDDDQPKIPPIKQPFSTKPQKRRRPIPVTAMTLVWAAKTEEEIRAALYITAKDKNLESLKELFRRFPELKNWIQKSEAGNRALIYALENYGFAWLEEFAFNLHQLDKMSFLALLINLYLAIRRYQQNDSIEEIIQLLELASLDPSDNFGKIGIICQQIIKYIDLDPENKKINQEDKIRILKFLSNFNNSPGVILICLEFALKIKDIAWLKALVEKRVESLPYLPEMPFFIDPQFFTQITGIEDLKLHLAILKKISTTDLLSLEQLFDNLIVAIQQKDRDWINTLWGRIREYLAAYPEPISQESLLILSELWELGMAWARENDEPEKGLIIRFLSENFAPSLTLVQWINCLLLAFRENFKSYEWIEFIQKNLDQYEIAKTPSEIPEQIINELFKLAQANFQGGDATGLKILSTYFLFPLSLEQLIDCLRVAVDSKDNNWIKQIVERIVVLPNLMEQFKGLSLKKRILFLDIWQLHTELQQSKEFMQKYLTAEIDIFSSALKSEAQVPSDRSKRIDAFLFCLLWAVAIGDWDSIIKLKAIKPSEGICLTPLQQATLNFIWKKILGFHPEGMRKRIIQELLPIFAAPIFKLKPSPLMLFPVAVKGMIPPNIAAVVFEGIPIRPRYIVKAATVVLRNTANQSKEEILVKQNAKFAWFALLSTVHHKTMTFNERGDERKAKTAISNPVAALEMSSIPKWFADFELLVRRSDLSEIPDDRLTHQRKLGSLLFAFIERMDNLDDLALVLQQFQQLIIKNQQNGDGNQPRNMGLNALYQRQRNFQLSIFRYSWTMENKKEAKIPALQEAKVPAEQVTQIVKITNSKYFSKVIEAIKLKSLRMIQEQRMSNVAVKIPDAIVALIGMPRDEWVWMSNWLTDSCGKTASARILKGLKAEQGTPKFEKARALLEEKIDKFNNWYRETFPADTLLVPEQKRAISQNKLEAEVSVSHSLSARGA